MLPAPRSQHNGLKLLLLTGVSQALIDLLELLRL